MHARDGRPESPGPGSAGAALLLTGPADGRTDGRRGPLALPGGPTAALLPVECGGGGCGCSDYAAGRLTGSIQLLEVQPLPTQPWTQPHLECQAVPGVADGSANPGPSSPSTHEPRAGSQRERPFLKWRERRCCRLVSMWAVCPCMLWARRGVSVCGSVVHVA